MAFGLFNSGAAAAYARSFTPWKANGGFDNVKSDIGKEMFSKIPLLNFKAEVEMAKAGLAGYTGAKKQQMVNESSERIMDKKIEYYDRDREDRQKNAKKAALVQMLGGSGASRAVANRGSSSELLRGFTGGDPGVMASNLTGINSRLQAEAANQNARGQAAAVSAITGIPQGSSTPEPQITMPQSRTQTVQPVAPAPVTSGGGSEFDFDQALTNILEQSKK